MNQKHIDPIAARFTAISKNKICTLILEDGPYTNVPQVFEVAVHPKVHANNKKILIVTRILNLETDHNIELMNFILNMKMLKIYKSAKRSL